MRAAYLLLSVTLLAGSSTGCTIFFGDDDDCAYVGDAEPAIGLRNPDTGQCEYYGGGGGGDCYDYATGAPEADIAWPDWGQCYGACDGLAEDACQETAGCRAVYQGDCPEELDCDTVNYDYYGCWPTAPSGPVQGGGCSQLDAYECSRHDDCIARHYPGGCADTGSCAPGFTPDIGNFEVCAAEPEQRIGCYGNADCPLDTRCNASEVCLPPPDCDPNTGACDAVCYGYCVPDMGGDPGNCYDEALCDAPTPDCPDGTIAGVKDGCWTGYCIPVADCEPAPSCAATPTEQGCIARADCAAIYEGVDCSCDETGCTCADWLYRDCEAN